MKLSEQLSNKMIDLLEAARIYHADKRLPKVLELGREILEINKQFIQLEADLEKLIEWAKTDNPIEGREKWNALPEHIQDHIAPYPYSAPEAD